MINQGVEREREDSPLFAAYFKGAIALVLTLGASWGLLLLWKIGFAKSFSGINVFEVNAHGHAQIFGWVGLFIMGAAWHLLPKQWKVSQERRQLTVGVLGLMVTGIVIRSVGMAMTGQAGALGLTLAGGALELIAIGIFTLSVVQMFRRSRERLTAANAFLLTAVALYVIQAIVGLWHTVATMLAPTHDALIWQIATWQAPLRDLQVHGLALFMIFGVGMSLFPRLWGVAATGNRRGWWAYALLLLALIGQIVIFLAYRYTGQNRVAAFLMLPWLLLPIGAWLIGGPWRLWRPLPVGHDGARYMRVAWAWLFLSFGMLLLMPVYQVVSGIAFSHAYYGAIRHAITVGFVSITMMGMAMRLHDEWSGSTARWPLAPFILINIGCAWRVGLQVWTDWHEPAFMVVGVSAIFEVAALAWWGQALWRRMSAPAPAVVLERARQTA